MSGLSRREKYKELRESLQHETDTDLGTPELSRFESRLNRIDAETFAPPQRTEKNDYDAVHARTETFPEFDDEPVKEPEPVFNTPLFDKNENYTSTFDNDYLDAYIREVKQYNIDQGNARSENTQVNVLDQIRRPAPASPAPQRPYPRQAQVQTPAANTRPGVKANTTDIPFMSGRNNPIRPSIEDEYRQFDEPLSMTKEDIMAEVQNMVNGTQSAQIPNIGQNRDSTPAVMNDDDSLKRSMEAEKLARQQLMQETSQIRMQMNDYEDGLSDVSNSVKNNNRILNLVLVVLIIVLLVILAVLFYAIVFMRGV